MKKVLFITGMFFFALFSSYSLKVGVDEIKNAAKDIDFVNYTGKHDRNESVFVISLIGQRLSDGVKKDNEYFKFYLKYSIIHAVDDSSSDKFDAAIISLDKDSQVDHIRNLRVIISSYLQKKFAYTKKEADTLAFFVTIYNAVYRNNLDYFTKAYKPNVLKYIDAGNAGLSTKYYEWAGRTKIIIPLTNGSKKDSLDTTLITDDKVIDKLKTDSKDKGITERKDIVEIKQKEVEKKTVELEKDKKTVDKQKDEIKKEEKKLDETKKELDKKKEEIAKKEELVKNEKDEKKSEKLKEEVAKDKDKLNKEEEKIKKEETKLENKKEEVKKEEAKIEEKKEVIVKKQEEIQKDKKEIKNDETTKNISENKDKAKEDLTKKDTDLKAKEKELDNREQALKEGASDKNMFANKLYYLKTKDYMENGHYNNEMYIINAVDKKVEVRSEISSICGHKYDVSKNGVVVIAHQGQNTAPHFLVLLDRSTLKVVKQSKEEVFLRSFVETRDDFFYAVIKENDKEFSLGKFNLNLELVKKSSEKIDSDTFISFFGNSIYVGSPDKKIIVLSKDELVLLEKITPP